MQSILMFLAIMVYAAEPKLQCRPSHNQLRNFSINYRLKDCTLKEKPLSYHEGNCVESELAPLRQGGARIKRLKEDLAASCRAHRSNRVMGGFAPYIIAGLKEKPLSYHEGNCVESELAPLRQGGASIKGLKEDLAASCRAHRSNRVMSGLDPYIIVGLKENSEASCRETLLAGAVAKNDDSVMTAELLALMEKDEKIFVKYEKGQVLCFPTEEGNEIMYCVFPKRKVFVVKGGSDPFDVRPNENASTVNQAKQPDVPTKSNVDEDAAKNEHKSKLQSVFREMRISR